MAKAKASSEFERVFPWDAEGELYGVDLDVEHDTSEFNHARDYIEIQTPLGVVGLRRGQRMWIDWDNKTPSGETAPTPVWEDLPQPTGRGKAAAAKE